MHLNNEKLDAPFLGIQGAPQPLNEETDWGEEHCNRKGPITGAMSSVIISIKLMGKKRKGKQFSAYKNYSLLQKVSGKAPPSGLDWPVSDS